MVQQTCKEKRSGVAARFLSKNPAAIPVNCFAYSPNHCLQGIGKNVVYIRDAIEIVKELVNSFYILQSDFISSLQLFNKNLTVE